MKKIMILGLSACALFATNGDSLIGLGAKSRAMGGVGIATFFGAENVLSNPALISKSKGVEVDFGATVFMPDVSANDKSSSADLNIIPEVSLSQEINDYCSFGIGMFGSAGMGVDYRGSGDPSLMEARTNLLLMKFAPSLTYKRDNFAFGLAPVVQYGSLDISYNNGSPVGSGSSDDFGIGFEAGISYDINENITLGVVYKSKIAMEYKNTLSTASAPFVTNHIFSNTFADDLEQPSEYGVGISYNFLDNFNISFDYKKIKWGSAKGYKDFGWRDQNVYALGAKYEKNGTWYAIGYNYAKNPITLYSGTTSAEQALNMFNYLMFPATSETHFSLGAGTNLTKNLSIDFDLLYSPSNTINATVMGGANLKVEHSETSVAFSMRYNFK